MLLLRSLNEFFRLCSELPRLDSLSVPKMEDLWEASRFPVCPWPNPPYLYFVGFTLGSFKSIFLNSNVYILLIIAYNVA